MMNVLTRRRDWLRARYLLLPAIYVVAVVLTAMTSISKPGGTYYRIIGICPPAGSVGMVSENMFVLVGAFLLLGTPWWYAIGRIGWDSRQRNTTLGRSLRGAAISLLTCLVSGGWTHDTYLHDHDPARSIGMVAQYWLVSLLCLGAFISMGFSIQAAFTRER